MASRKWTPQQRLKQSQAIQSWQPWNNSTGARSEAGKAISAKNADKGKGWAQMRALHKQLNALLMESKHCLEFMPFFQDHRETLNKNHHTKATLGHNYSQSNLTRKGLPDEPYAYPLIYC